MTDTDTDISGFTMRDHERRVRVRLERAAMTLNDRLRPYLADRACWSARSAIEMGSTRYEVHPVYRLGQVSYNDLYEVAIGPRGGRKVRRWQRTAGRWTNWTRAAR